MTNGFLRVLSMAGCMSATYLAAHGAWAQTEEKAAAEALFVRGRELADRGDYEAACPKLEASLKLDPAIGTRLHLADCYDRQGRTASAWATFMEVASLARIEGQTAREEIAVARARALELRLSRFEVRVPEANRLPELTVQIDDVLVPQPSWGLALPFDPGKHSLRVTAPGYKAYETVIDTPAEGQSSVVDVPALWPEPPEAPSPSAAGRAKRDSQPAQGEDADAGTTQRIWGIVIGGLGLASVSAGAVLGTQAVLKNDASMAHCKPDDPTLCSPRGVELRDEAFTYATGSTVSLIVGGGVVAAGLAVFFTAPWPPEAEAQKVGVRAVVPFVGPDAAGFSLGGRW
ncbi:MAG: hypothetical protein HOV80_08025 [Polyangiaceae bacterium]|nr:hypothetical protein [Polyangiaceae bacterium]